MRCALTLTIALVASSSCVLVMPAAYASDAPSIAGCAMSWNRTGPGSQRATVIKGDSLKAFIVAGSTTCTIQFRLRTLQEAVAEGIWKNGTVADWLPLRTVTVSPTLVVQPNASVHGATLKYPA
jgi:hypothetical protein